MMDPDNKLNNYNGFSEVRTFRVPNGLAGKRLDVILQSLLPEFSRSRMQRWIESGKVSIEENVAHKKSRIQAGQALTVCIEPEPCPLASQASPIELNILYEDSALLILNKPAGLVVHPGAGNLENTLLNGLLYYAPSLKEVPRAGIVHRLDKDTSGLLVVAKSIQAQFHLIRQLQNRTMHRHYLTLVEGNVKQNGSVAYPIGRHPKDRTKMAVVNNGKPALTDYFIRECFAQFTLLECKLQTGRTHQIRVHMKAIGHPIAADPVYGRNNNRYQYPDRIQQTLAAFKRQALHAYRLALIHPLTQAPLSWQIALPKDMQHILEVIRDFNPA